MEIKENRNKELIMVGISDNSNNAQLIRAAGRLAKGQNAKIMVVHVETISEKVNHGNKESVFSEAENLAKAFGAEMVKVQGNDVARQLAEIARVKGAKKLILGMSKRKIYSKNKDIGSTVKEYMPSLDVYILPLMSKDKREAGTYYSYKNIERKNQLNMVKQFLLLFMAMAACTFIGVIFRNLGIPYVNIVMIYILGVMVLSTIDGSFLFMLFTSFTAVMTVNFFFAEPLYSFYYKNAVDLVTFIMMFIMAVTISMLVRRFKSLFDTSHRNSARTGILFEQAMMLLSAEDLDDVERIVSEQVSKITGRSVIIYENPDLRGRDFNPIYFPKTGLSVSQLYAADNDNDRYIAKQLIDGKQVIQGINGAYAEYFNLKHDDRVYMAVGVYQAGEKPIGKNSFEAGLIASLLNEAAVVVERILQKK
ncbi:MAG: DUF4118 domain-containing protein [Eubacteriales bacterium]|nr:DUF4118 domain-containing protein [Eubacteriales bacterium]